MFFILCLLVFYYNTLCPIWVQTRSFNFINIGNFTMALIPRFSIGSCWSLWVQPSKGIKRGFFSFGIFSIGLVWFVTDATQLLCQDLLRSRKLCQSPYSQVTAVTAESFRQPVLDVFLTPQYANWLTSCRLYCAGHGVGTWSAEWHWEADPLMIRLVPSFKLKIKYLY